MAGEYDLLLSQETLDEVVRVLSDPDVARKLRITSDILFSTITLLISKAKFVKVKRKVAVCRDPHDDKFLECALAGKAHYVVSADEDLLSLKTFEGIPIVNLPTFWRALQQQS